ncbi:hypothetical protein [Clostridium intestinale]|uniref:hypothetical protein n=1 Tax=Clostridium intestinale TaxID=36845 RepID=UPI002DD6A547|nr:hypothetical protein [Clostridium intestinale]WRY53394.1 hypothetical protein P8F83_09335 [Clostridium intestinale]
MSDDKTINYPDENIENLYLTIYIIGYMEQGESIIITVDSLKPNDRLYYVGVIDSYCKKDVNITTEILKSILAEKNEKNKKLDLLCWTHPHDDHTKGMDDIIKNYCNEETLIAMPNVFYMNKNLSSETQKVIECIKEMNYGKHVQNRGRLQTLSGESQLQILNIGKSEDIQQMTIDFFGPYDNISLMQSEDNIDWNKFSTSLLISINGVNIFLGGDVPNMSIKSFKNFPKYLNFVKIPHHTSSTSSILIEKLNGMGQADIACTTMYSNKLPESELLLSYIDITKEVFSTTSTIIDSKVLSNNNNNYEKYKNVHIKSLDENEYGILKIKIDVINSEYTPYIAGNATRVSRSI